MKTIEKLPEAELDVMLCLWRYDAPVRTAQLFADVQASRGWTISTLKVLLSRLVEKDFVELTREGRFTLYRALVSEKTYRRKETKNLVKRYYQNSVKSMIAALVSEEGLSGTDLAEIEAIIKRAGEKDVE